MTNIATIEDVLESILGLVLGGAAGQYELASAGGQSGSGKSTINNAYRPATVAGPGFWLIAQSDTLSHVGGWAPEYDKDAVTFYTWTQAGAEKQIFRLTVWVGVTNRDNAQNQDHNSDNPADVTNAAANPVVALGNAWELIQNEIPQVAGPGTSFDPDTIEAVRQVLGSLTTQAMDISGELSDETNKVNTKSDDFKGSAEAAWYHQVEVTNSYLSDINDQNKRWDGALSAASKAASDFVTAVKTASYNWSQIEPKGTWQHPYRVIAAMFNQRTLSTAGPGNSNAWNLGTQYADANGYDWTDVTYTFTLPTWMDSLAINPFSVSDWSTVDQKLRTKWVNHLLDTWKPVLDSAATLVKAFADARNPLYIADPAPVAPLPMPNTMPNTPYDPYANIGNPFANIGNPFANIGNPFANIGNPFANIGNPFANIGNPFANQPFVSTTNPFANTGGDGSNNPFLSRLDPYAYANTGNGSNHPFYQQAYRSASPFANTGDTNPFFTTLNTNPYPNNDGLTSNNPFDSPANPYGAGNTPFYSSLNPFANNAPTLGDLTPNQLNQLASDGGLNDTPLTPQEAAYLQQNGLGPVPPGATLGDLTPQQLDALQKAGLLDRTPMTTAQTSDLGLPTNTLGNVPNPQELGDLTTKQLNQLQADGGLNGTPVTPQEAAYLQQNGLGNVPSGESLGQLTPEQLDALQRGGLLNQTPLTTGELNDLGLGPTSTVDTSPFPTTVDGVGVGTNLPVGANLPVGNGGIPLGDVSGPGALLTGTGSVGTGGLSSVPGVGGAPGGLNAAHLGTTAGGGTTVGGGSTVGMGGPGSGLTGVPGAADAATGIGGESMLGEGMGGMPFMPGMFGGGANQGQGQRDRTRNTWLKEDEEVWGTEPDVAPAVVGRKGRRSVTSDPDAPRDEPSNVPGENRPYRRR